MHSIDIYEVRTQLIDDIYIDIIQNSGALEIRFETHFNLRRCKVEADREIFITISLMMMMMIVIIIMHMMILIEWILSL